MTEGRVRKMVEREETKHSFVHDTQTRAHTRTCLPLSPLFILPVLIAGSPHTDHMFSLVNYR